MSPTKAQRLIVLTALEQQGLLQGRSLQQIADAFPDTPHRSTILRDLRDLDDFDTAALLEAVRAKLQETKR